MATLTPWASIPTQFRRGIIKHQSVLLLWGRSEDTVSLCVPMIRALTALILALALSLSSSFGLLAKPQHRHKSKKPPAPPCRDGCKPETPAPQVPVETPDDDARQKELAGLARELRNRAPGAYEKLSAFATKNTTNVWGARAALAASASVGPVCRVAHLAVFPSPG